MGIWGLILILQSWAATLHRLESWQALAPDGKPSIQLTQRASNEWELQLLESGLAPQLNAVGRFKGSPGVALAAKVSALDKKLAFRESVLGKPVFETKHIESARLNKHRLQLQGEFGSELSALLDEFLQGSWRLVEGHAVGSEGRISKFHNGRAIATFLPEHSLHCRWRETVWECAFPEGTLRFGRRAP